MLSSLGFSKVIKKKINLFIHNRHFLHEVIRTLDVTETQITRVIIKVTMMVESLSQAEIHVEWKEIFIHISGMWGK
jgi:hypothetical protein